MRRQLKLPGLALAGVGLGLAIVSTPMLGLWAMGLRPGLAWNAPVLAAAVCVATCTSTLALALFYQLRMPWSIKLLYRPLGAAACVGLGLAVSACLVISASGLTVNSLSSYAAHLSTATMALLAAGGSVSVLTALTLASLAETRSRASARRDKAEMLQKHAMRDPLTDLPN